MIVTVEGPSTPVMVRRKDAGRGHLGEQCRLGPVDSAPSFYAVATTGPLSDILSDTDNLRHGITIERVIRAVGITAEAEDSGDFLQALMRVRTNEGRYRVLQGKVELTEETLFRTDVILPANLTEGEYKVRLFLLRDKRVIADAGTGDRRAERGAGAVDLQSGAGTAADLRADVAGAGGSCRLGGLGAFRFVRA